MCWVDCCCSSSCWLFVVTPHILLAYFWIFCTNRLEDSPDYLFSLSWKLTFLPNRIVVLSSVGSEDKCHSINSCHCLFHSCALVSFLLLIFTPATSTSSNTMRRKSFHSLVKCGTTFKMQRNAICQRLFSSLALLCTRVTTTTTWILHWRWVNSCSREFLRILQLFWFLPLVLTAALNYVNLLIQQVSPLCFFSHSLSAAFLYNIFFCLFSSLLRV